MYGNSTIFSHVLISICCQHLILKRINQTFCLISFGMWVLPNLKKSTYIILLVEKCYNSREQLHQHRILCSSRLLVCECPYLLQSSVHLYMYKAKSTLAESSQYFKNHNSYKSEILYSDFSCYTEIS